MKATKEELIKFLEENVLIPAETHPDADITIKRKINVTRMRLNNQVSAEKVQQFFWNAMLTDKGEDTHKRFTDIGTPTFETVQEDFRTLCER